MKSQDTSGGADAKSNADTVIMKDKFDRHIKYLRVSLTDRCNFRCTYCRPENVDTKCHDDLLTFEEILTLVRIMVGLGITKVRLTGGEPLVRKNADRLVEMLSGLDGIDDLAMTTNAVFLDRYARPLADAGLKRVIRQSRYP